MFYLFIYVITRCIKPFFREYVCMFNQHLDHRQNATQGQFLSGVQEV